MSVSAQDGIVALGKAHTHSTPSLSSLPKVQDRQSCCWEVGGKGGQGGGGGERAELSSAVPDCS